MLFYATFAGNDSCHWLLSDGHFQGYSEWQPFGCMMHLYSKRYFIHYTFFFCHS